MEGVKDKKEFTKLMTGLGIIFDQEVQTLKLDFYFNILKGFPIEDIRRGVERIVKERTTASFPKPAEIIEKITGTPDDKVNLAWEKVVKAIQKYGNYRSIEFDDSVIHSVIQVMGGWEEAGNWEIDEMKWKRIEFCKLYNSMALKGSHSKYLVGIIERINGGNGYDIPKPIKIGFDDVEQVGRSLPNP